MSHPQAPYATPPQWTEARLQQECGNWLNQHHRAAYQLFWHTPNGEARDRITGARLKAMHAKPGVPDCFLAMSSKQAAYWIGMIRIEARIHHGLFIEFKTDAGSLSPQQKAFIAGLQGAGFRVEVIRSLPAFIELLTDYLAA